jgi:hypothetical protein
MAVQMALGGSTNAAVHIIAMAGRAGIRLTLDDLDAMARHVPVLANLFPSGDCLMEDFYYAGGLPALMQVIRSVLSTAEATANGRTIGENIATAEVLDPEVIRPLARPVSSAGALATLHGNLAPHGAVIKPSAATPKPKPALPNGVSLPRCSTSTTASSFPPSKTANSSPKSSASGKLTSSSHIAPGTIIRITAMWVFWFRMPPLWSQFRFSAPTSLP